MIAHHLCHESVTGWFVFLVLIIFCQFGGFKKVLLLNKIA